MVDKNVMVSKVVPCEFELLGMFIVQVQEYWHCGVTLVVSYTGRSLNRACWCSGGLESKTYYLFVARLTWQDHEGAGGSRYVICCWAWLICGQEMMFDWFGAESIWPWLSRGPLPLLIGWPLCPLFWEVLMHSECGVMWWLYIDCDLVCCWPGSGSACAIAGFEAHRRLARDMRPNSTYEMFFFPRARAFWAQMSKVANIRLRYDPRDVKRMLLVKLELWRIALRTWHGTRSPVGQTFDKWLTLLPHSSNDFCFAYALVAWLFCSCFCWLWGFWCGCLFCVGVIIFYLLLTHIIVL